MHASPCKAVFKATVRIEEASLESMSTHAHAAVASGKDGSSLFLGNSVASRVLRATSAVFVLPFLLLALMAGNAAAQSNPEAAAQPEMTAQLPAFNESLRPALQQVGFCMSQLHIDHWRVSNNWKAQLQSDADSIQQDLSHQLPALFQQAESAPASLDAQMRAMQNVDALYDVLVRLTMAADLTEKKNDAAMLDNALQRLESARKQASDQLLRAASLQNQQMIHMQARLAEDAAPKRSSNGPKTIIVDNGVSHRTRRRTVHHRERTHAKPASKSNPDANNSAAAKAPS